MAQHASGQLRVNADVEIVRIEPASEADVEPRVVVRLAQVIPDGMGGLSDALAMIGKLDANVAAEQVRDRDLRGPAPMSQYETFIANGGYRARRVQPNDRATLDNLDHNLDDLRSADEEAEPERDA